MRSHFIAAHVAPDASGAPLGIPVTDMLSALDINHDDGDQGNGAYRVVDEDRDGVVKILEDLRGSSDDDLDTDDDSLSDCWEIHEGWTVTAAGQPPLRVYPSPTSENSDNDGHTDLQEFALGTHPLRLDTDRERLGDAGDADPLTYEPIAPSEVQVILNDCSLEGCANAWADTPGYNLVALRWQLPAGSQAVVLRSVSNVGVAPDFDPRTVQRHGDLEALLQACAVTRIYDGASFSYEDYDLNDNRRPTYHFYGTKVGTDGVRYYAYAYAGSEAVDFEPAPYSPHYYHVEQVNLSPVAIDQVFHDAENADFFNHDYAHEFEVRYSSPTGGEDVVAGLQPPLRDAFVRPRLQSLPFAQSIYVNTLAADDGIFVLAPSQPDGSFFPPVTLCVRNGGRIRTRLMTFDRDDVLKDQYASPDDSWPHPGAPPGNVFDSEWPCWPFVTTYGDPQVPDNLPYAELGPQCDDRWLSYEKQYTFFDPGSPAQEWTPGTSATDMPAPANYAGWAPPEGAWVYRELYEAGRDRNWFSNETQQHASKLMQWVARSRASMS